MHAGLRGPDRPALVGEVWPLLEDGRITSRIHSVHALEAVREAHAILDAQCAARQGRARDGPRAGAGTSGSLIDAGPGLAGLDRVW
jgi:hypothetical protein